MGLIEDMKLIGKVRVGSGGGLSDEYPVLRVNRRIERETVEGKSPSRERKIRWDLELVAAPSGDVYATQAALLSAVESELCRTGEPVALTIHGDTMTLPGDTGAAGGSMPGYPRCSISDSGSWRGGFYAFTLSVETLLVEPNAGAGSLVRHTTTTEESTDDLGQTTTTVSGTVVVGPGVNAKSWVLTNVITPVEVIVAGTDEKFSKSFKFTHDATRCDYRYTIAPADAVSPGGGLESPSLTDETRRDDSGRIVRTIRGGAKGAGATSFAIAQEPVPGAGEVFTDHSITEPEVPHGRVSFFYGLLIGTVDTSIVASGGGARYITKFNERISITSHGERRERVIEYAAGDPQRVLGPTSPAEYLWTAEVEWIGTPPPGNADTVIVFPTGFSGDDLVRQTGYPDKAKPVAGVHRQSISAVFRRVTPLATIPTPRQVAWP